MSKAPRHPGTVLNEDFLEKFNMQPGDLASQIGYTRAYVLQVIRCNNRMTEKFARGLANVFRSTNVQFWLDLQYDYEEYQNAKFGTNVAVKDNSVFDFMNLRRLLNVGPEEVTKQLQTHALAKNKMRDDIIEVINRFKITNVMASKLTGVSTGTMSRLNSIDFTKTPDEISTDILFKIAIGLGMKVSPISLN